MPTVIIGCRSGTAGAPVYRPTSPPLSTLCSGCTSTSHASIHLGSPGTSLQCGNMAVLSTLSRKDKAVYYLTLIGRLAFLYRLVRFVLIDGYRHLRARGLVLAAEELYGSLKSVSLLVAPSDL